MEAKERLEKSLEDVLIQNPELSKKYDQINQKLKKEGITDEEIEKLENEKKEIYANLTDSLFAHLTNRMEDYGKKI